DARHSRNASGVEGGRAKVRHLALTGATLSWISPRSLLTGVRFRAYPRSSYGLLGGRCLARGVLGGQFSVNDIPSSDDLVQFRRDRGPGHGDSVGYGKPEPGPVGVASGSGGRDAMAAEHQRSDEPHLLRQIVLPQ